jgi:hypothetical protein
VEHHLPAGRFVELLDGDAAGAECLDAGLGDLLRDLDHVGEVVGGSAVADATTAWLSITLDVTRQY